MSDWTLTDFDDRPIVVGTRVRYWEDQGEGCLGTVLDLGEWDYDWSDEQERAVGTPPSVKVRWDEGDEQSYVTTEWDFNIVPFDGTYPVAGQVEELVVVG